jgi:hypothetical protein
LAREGERGHIRRQVEASAIREYQIAQEDMHLALASALAFNDVFGPDRDALGDTSGLHATSASHEAGNQCGKRRFVPGGHDSPTEIERVRKSPIRNQKNPAGLNSYDRSGEDR